MRHSISLELCEAGGQLDHDCGAVSASGLRRAGRSRAFLLSAAVALTALATAAVCWATGRPVAGLGVLAAALLLLLLLCVAILQRNSSIALAAQRRNESNLRNIEKLVSRAEWRMEQMGAKLAAETRKRDAAKRLAEIQSSVETVRERLDAMMMHSADASPGSATPSEYDVELMLIELLATRKSAGH